MTDATPSVGRIAAWDTYRRNGFYFRAAAITTITMGLFMHLCRVFYGDVATLAHVMTPTFDRILLIPMTYAAVTGIALWRRVDFPNTAVKVFFTWSLIYIGGSVPMHIYFGVIRGNVDFYFSFFPLWFSFVLFPFYAALLIMFARLTYRR